MFNELDELEDDMNLGIEDHELEGGDSKTTLEDSFPYGGVPNEDQMNQNTDNNNPDNDGDENGDDLIVQILKSKGVSDPSSIKWTDEETGEVVEKNFYELSLEDQMEILSSRDEEQQVPDLVLREEEQELFKVLQDNDITLGDYIQFVKDKAIEEYLQSGEGHSFTVDTLTDEDIYVLDLKSRFPELTDDELLSALEIEKTNPTLWEKKTKGLREDYKQKELESIKESELEDQQQKDRDQEEFQNTIIDALNVTDSISKFELDLEEKEAMAQFILGSDVTGKRYIAKAIEDPETLVEMAWFAIYGKEHIDTLENFYADEYKKAVDAAYKKGLEEGSKSTSKTTKTTKQTSVVQKETNKSTVEKDPQYDPLYGRTSIPGMTLDDLYNSDDF